MRLYHQMAFTSNKYVVFELHPYHETPQGIKGMYPAKEWQVLARQEPRQMIQKVNNVYKIQGLEDRPKYVISPSKPIGLTNLPNALFSEQRQITEYLEGAYGGAGIKNQPYPDSTKSLPKHLENLLEAYLRRRNKSLPFSHEHGYLLNANRTKFIFMDPRGKLFTITAVPNSSSTGAGSSSARSKSPSRRPPSGAGSSSARSKSPSSRPPPSGAGSSSARSKSSSSRRSPSGPIKMNRLSNYNKNDPLVLHHLKDLGRGLWQSLTDEEKKKLKKSMPVQSMINADQVSRSDLRLAYKRLALLLHPNKGSGNKNNEQKKIMQALEWLKD